MAAAPTYRSRWPVYAEQWDAMTIKPDRANEVAKVAKRLFAAKPRYAAIELVTGVPWYMIAAIHERESGQDWRKSLAQGDRWDRVSVNRPAGRGPFASFEAAAIDALQIDGLTLVKDWRLEKTFYYWEKYNGWGYHWHGLPSAYLFGATNIQKVGKFTSDGKWSPSTWDVQIGCCAMLRAMMDLDKTIKPVRED